MCIHVYGCGYIQHAYAVSHKQYLFKVKDKNHLVKFDTRKYRCKTKPFAHSLSIIVDLGEFSSYYEKCEEFYVGYILYNFLSNLKRETCIYV